MNASDYFTGNQLNLAEAIDTDSAGSVAAALAAGGNANGASKEGVTPLIFALANRKKKAAMELLNRGANPNQRAANGENAVTVATQLAPDDLDYLRLVLKHGGDPNTRQSNKEPILVILVAQPNLPGIRLLAASGADLNIKDRTDTHAILVAAMIDHWDAVETLLEAGADWKVTWGGGTTVAWRAYKSNVKPDSPLYPARQKVIAFLEAKGVKFPPPSPAEVRQQAHSH